MIQDNLAGADGLARDLQKSRLASGEAAVDIDPESCVSRKILQPFQPQNPSRVRAEQLFWLQFARCYKTCKNANTPGEGPCKS